MTAVDDVPDVAPATRDGAADARGDALDAVVVGAGVAGLVAARDLAVAGLRVLVVDAATAPGGAVTRHTVAGLDLDAGAESFATRGGTVAALAGELGLGAAVTAPAPLGAWVQLPSGAGTLPRAGLLGVPADPWAPDVRRTIGLLGALRAGVDRLLPPGVGVHPATTFGSLVRVRMGRRVLDRLVAPVVGGVHAADPSDLDVRTVAPGLLPALAEHGSLGAAVASLRALAPAGAAVGGLVGGMHTLPRALERDLTARGGHVAAGTRAVSVTRTGTVWSVRVAGPDGDGEVTAPRLVLATPATATVGLLAPVLPALSGLRPDPGADVVLVTLVVDAPALDAAPRGTGVLVAPAAQGTGPDGPRAKALTHATAKWPWLARAAGPGRHVLRLSYGRAGDAGLADVADLPDADLTTLALRDASTLLGVPLTPDQVVGSARVRWSQSLPQPSATHRAAADAVRTQVAAVDGLEVCGAWVAGNGLAAVVPHARAAAGRLTAPLPTS
ncbi:protoporphyrinogen/coproporphyrinogen oxidase [Cellulomonas aerilata]|uniref:Protoporphyrinogen oxidase n=1 Tax=Cellulomonas aerilata TaxID=515326 RepID=A0A512D7S4_9CELL|nr:FAD-dependent oxidoreductase [Cellulomonas aerilata]GEO32534.1 protoporphyrinogen oxidase [Cellulomonas aerilata]